MDLNDLDRQYHRQAVWFAGERNRLLRKVDIASKRHVLDLGAGTGVTLPDLAWRCAGIAVGFDCDEKALRQASGIRVAGQAEALPFSSGSFDLVFAQMVFLWINNLDGVIAEIFRVLKPEGHLIAVAEPDYGGVIEYPVPTEGLKGYGEWLRAEGADTEVGRKLVPAFRAAGFEVSAGVHPCDPTTYAGVDSGFADGRSSEEPAFAFLPYFYFHCRKTR